MVLFVFGCEWPKLFSVGWAVECHGMRLCHTGLAFGIAVCIAAGCAGQGVLLLLCPGHWH